jgi:hypothetical protein
LFVKQENEEGIKILKRILKINHKNEKAQQALNQVQ